MNAQQWMQEQLEEHRYDALYNITVKIDKESFQQTLILMRKYISAHPEKQSNLFKIKYMEFNHYMAKNFPRVILSEKLWELCDILYD